MIVPLTTACIAFAAGHYQLSTPVMLALYQVEAGKVGQTVANRDGTGAVLSRDIGPFQINDAAWLGTLTAHWRRSSREETFLLLRDNGCANALAAAMIFRICLDQAKGDYGVAVGFYNSHTPRKAELYRRRFVAAWRRLRLDAAASRRDPSGGRG